MSADPRGIRPPAGRARTVLVASVALAAIVGAAVAWSARPAEGERSQLRAKRVVMFTMPGVTWLDVARGTMPELKRIAEDGASAALAVRTASTRPSPVRGFLTLGAGNRGAGSDIEEAEHAFMADDPLQDVSGSVTGEAELTLRVGAHRKGEIVHLGVPALQAAQDRSYHGTRVGALGEALADAGIKRAVVSAAGHREFGDVRDVRGSPVLGLVDETGTVDAGQIRGMLRGDAGTPFGVHTIQRALQKEFTDALHDTRVVLVEGGETMRADEFAPLATPRQAIEHRQRALVRTDRLLKTVVDELGPEDLLLALAPSSPRSWRGPEHLTVAVAYGAGVRPGELVSSSTRRPGIVTLTDVAPTVLAVLGVPRPDVMSGRPIDVTETDRTDRVGQHAGLDRSSQFRERFVRLVFYIFVGLFALLSILVGLVFLARARLRSLLIGVCYFILAVPLASFLIAFFPLWRSGTGGAHTVLWTLGAALAALAWFIPGPRWVGATALLAATAGLVAGELLGGGQPLVNAVFGNSVLAAGRFYGIPNTGSAVFFGAGVLALTGLAEASGPRRRTLIVMSGFVVLLALIGLPPWGADFGGLLTGIAAVAIILIVLRGGGNLPWRPLVVAGIIAVIATAAVAYADSLRSAEMQTHLGRFAEGLLSGDGTAWTVIRRKAAQSFGSLGFTRFTYIVPLGAAALAVLLHRQRGPLGGALPSYPWFRAGLAGLLAAGVLGFALNDSGVAVPALLLGQAVPVLVLLGLDQIRPRGQTTDQPSQAS